MSKITITIAGIVMLPLAVASAAVADNFNESGILQGQGYEHSHNRNTVLNAGAGNAGEGFDGHHNTFPEARRNESDFQRDLDPGQSGEHNQVPSAPPGQN